MYFLVKKLKKALVVSCIIIGMVHSFDVKVLLEKCKLQDNAQNTIELNCSDGFVVSYNSKLALGSQCPHSKLVISYCDDVIKINGKVLKEKILYIFPMLSHVVQLQLKSQVSYWIESYNSDIDTKIMPLKTLFEEMLEKNSPLSQEYCNTLLDCSQTIFELYWEYMIQNHKDLESYHEILTHYGQEYLQIQFIKHFIQNLENKHVTPEYRKILLKNKKKCYEFFSDVFIKTMEELLCEFLYALPRKIIQLIVQDKIKMIMYNGNKYQGNFILFQDKNYFLLINSIDINDYLLSVVRHEGFPGWPIEMNKVVAITCRTYLVYQILQAQKLDRAYHIENKNNHQTYKGYHDSAKIRQAIEETNNMILGYNGHPACTMYDVCCGGIIPALIDDPDLKKIPYLARPYACTSCKNHKSYSWMIDFSSEEITDRLKKEFPKIEKINEIQIYKTDKAGLVKKIKIIAADRTIMLTEKKFKLFFPEVKSYCFDIKKIHRRYFIEGKGFGHHRGLCQWGAYHLFRYEHWNCAEILKFYYPGTNLMKLNY